MINSFGLMWSAKIEENYVKGLTCLLCAVQSEGENDVLAAMFPDPEEVRLPQVCDLPHLTAINCPSLSCAGTSKANMAS
jgi:hypothetical protein